MRSLAEDAGGDPTSATATLAAALGHAAPEGVVRVFADELPTIAHLLAAIPPTAAGHDLAREVRAADAPAATAVEAPHPALVEPLSARELEVLRMLRSDLSGPEIARELHVSLNTLRTHTRRIYTKLGATSRRHALRRATELGLT